MNKITLQRRTKHLLLVLKDGERVGTAKQAPGNGRVYTAQAFGTEFSGLGQADLIGRIADFLNRRC